MYNMQTPNPNTPQQTSVDYYSDGFDDGYFDDAISSDDRLFFGSNLQEEEEDDDDDVADTHKVIIKKRNQRILTEDDIRQRMEDDLSQVSLVLSLPKPEASLLLCSFNWSVTKIYDSWFSDESGVREKVGLLEKKVFSIDLGVVDCGICFESFPFEKTSSAACGHHYCIDCWSCYISTSINNDGLGCLMLRCPEPSCRVAVGHDMIDLLVSRDDRNKYARCFVRSYIQENRKMKWCPGRDCDNAIEFLDGDGSFDVTCDCFTSFCWNCDEESHRPVDCDTVKKWISKNQSESENINYILTYCKPCPNCRRPIEKNEGCMHMTCRVCGHSFCWLCLASYNNHIQCNGYTDNVVRKKEMAQQSLEKYTHYFERWDANRKSKLKALEDFQHVKNVIFKRLSEIQGSPESNFDFITKAWLQVVECRRVLGWSYAYGYYLPEDEFAKKQFFEYLQGEAESGLEKLHNYAEKELEKFLESDGLSKDFTKFQTMLRGLTVVTGNYFEKLAKALENGLSDVVSLSNGASTSSSRSSTDGTEDYWFCDRCSYANPGSVLQCQMCVLFIEN
ncbi:probable E3 ubiquitin-protein ligase ARI8 [Ricinus communis]|uniref:RanBP-type and C3HC4-type zinc finger-containing protein 1 n=1 Tax=Ricinus communis TaxID=3988 RepID=B9R7N1_RICCO|nr:probable E3 ubiquitin-protein ligase ARI8 [Ricinus communis]EEF52511.1 Protein ariadne-1, putative [Ricinus communis]|eukprot:XP_002510324.1 probable E3 ubiquitin-protein ligase ARI8 [Ricinus communis]